MIALRYYGGKNRIAGWITKHMPPHKLYAEPFGGAASVLLAKRKTGVEIYNDLDSEIVNYFFVLRNNADELVRRLILTPYSREEYNTAQENSNLSYIDNVEKARNTFVRACMSFGGNGMYSPTCGFRSTPVTIPKDETSSYRSIVKQLHRVADRMSSVIIENMDYRDLLRRYDSQDSLFYVDPPYVLSTRSEGRKRYRHDDIDHEELFEVLNACKGGVMLSGYDSDIMDKYREAGWHEMRKKVHTNSGAKKEEILMINNYTETLFSTQES